MITDVLDVQISLEGGELSRADLLAYPLVKGESARVRLLNRDSDGEFIRTAIRTLGGGGQDDAHPSGAFHITRPAELSVWRRARRNCACR